MGALGYERSLGLNSQSFKDVRRHRANCGSWQIRRTFCQARFATSRQVLLTHEDLEQPSAHSTRATRSSIARVEASCTNNQRKRRVSSTEIKFGDMTQLSAAPADSLLPAELLVIVTTVDGHLKISANNSENHFCHRTN